MTAYLSISKDESEDLGFAISSLFCCAINLNELHEWCFYAIRETSQPDIPPYIFELAEFDGKLAQIFKLIGFVPSWRHDDSDEAALCGIAAARGRTVGESAPFSLDEAVSALHDRPAIADRFRKAFPFIQY